MRKPAILLFSIIPVVILLGASFVFAASVGVEWINDFPGTSLDRSHWDESAEGLYLELIAEGWYGEFDWANSWASKKDFTINNDDWVDWVDIALIGSHGSSTYDSFWGENLSSVMFYNTDMSPGEVFNLWGDYNLEWIALDCCSVLRDSSVVQWSCAMNGLHLILGFKNSMCVNAPGDGKIWGIYMMGNWHPYFDYSFSVTQSWFIAVDHVQPHGSTTVTARVVAEVYDNYNDHAWGHGYTSEDPEQDRTYWLWDHNAACQPPRTNTAEDRMMIYKAVEETITLDKAHAVAGALGLEGEIIRSDDGYYRLLDPPADDIFFQLHKNGWLLFGKKDKLFKVPDEPPRLYGNRSIITASAFLNGIGFYPDDAGEPEVGEEAIGEYERRAPGKGVSGKGAPVQEIPMLNWVFYPPEIGTGDVIYSRVGPGAKMKVYLGDRGEIIGAVGGWRRLEEDHEADVIPVDEAKLMVDEFKSKVSLLDVPCFDTFVISGTTLTFYEEGNETDDAMVFPTWLMTGTFCMERDGKAPTAMEGDFYFPAVEEFIPPVVTILSPENDSSFGPSDAVEFKAEVRYGAGGARIKWYSDIDGYLGEGDAITASLSAVSRDGEESTHSIKAVATDRRGKVGTDIVTVAIGDDGRGPWMYLTLDDSQYQQEDDLSLTISGGNNGEARRVNLYVFLILPNGRLQFWPSWSALAIPLLLDFPAVFELYDFPLLATMLPSTTPRIGAPGDYRFWAFLTDADSFELLTEISEVGFAVH
ncbi:MAG: hypothetical protein JW941_01010 [Candidatus Coatesbacteria bacterium]|nr:hypothetical protein [Candidatus Coatesbacteria bacterium]